MKVLMLKDFPGVGKHNELKEVNDGYARNFLIPKGIAVLAIGSTITQLQNVEKQRAEKERKANERAINFKNELDKRTFTIKVKVGNNNHIYGSVRESEVALKISEKMNFDLDKRQIILPKHIKELGQYTIEVKLGSGLIAKPKIMLINQNENAQEEDKK